ncbi:amidohydrolase family protein [Actinopolymorpha pittospori]|uniref:Imidazolonepropionase-like amidohydrolase n=1 Tax=Actinopolymorpha pittospori TaxID=648752 RepID=A0A927N593_9ACTN|nr:amidohydrolase family protein [Actinopolymorpha pittospori]MBE1609207.1 imidazolonepropionase-like amidohydrolase [Actinopolymorpha pittospori]
MSAFVIRGARVFDGERALGELDVRVVDERVAAVGAAGMMVPADDEVVDGSDATLLPGLIDAHTHTGSEPLRQALTFGITTELDMTSVPQTMIPLRREVAEDRTFADVRSPSVSLTHPQGHPHQLRRGMGDPSWPTATRVEDVAEFVEDRLAEGADYLKVHLEDGRVLGTSLPSVAPELITAAAREAHARDRMVLAHALTVDATRQVIAAGVDGLTHLFVDGPHTADVVERIAASGAFVVPTLSMLASTTGQSAGTDLARDPRVRSKLPADWLDNLAAPWGTLPPENFDVALASLAALRAAGVDVLAGTDAAHFGVSGVAHGASLHGELRLLVRAGMSPTEALRAATSLPAQRFGLCDRGRIGPGRRADLVLVAGDPTRDIGDTLSVLAVWRQGTRVPLASVQARP